jgi:hypothetical protein
MVSNLGIFLQMRADARRRLSPEEQDIAHFSRTARGLIGRADVTAA